MNWLRIGLSTLLVLALATASSAQAVQSTVVSGEPEYFGYLQIPGLTGGVTTPRQYAGWFRVDGYAMGSEATRGQGGTTQSALSTLIVTGDFVVATPQIMLAMVSLQTPYPTVTLDLFRDVNNPTQVAQIVATGARLAEMASSAESLTGTRLEISYSSISWSWMLPGGPRTTTLNVTTSGVAPSRGPTKTPNAAFPRASYLALLQVPGVRGGSTKPTHTDWIELSEVSSAIQRASLQSSTTTPSVTAKAYLGPGLPELARLAALGTVYPTVNIHIFRSPSDHAPILELALTNALATALIQHANQGGAGMDLTFDTQRIAWTYIDPISGRRTRGCWDWATNSGC